MEQALAFDQSHTVYTLTKKEDERMERDPLAYEEAMSRATEHHQRGNSISHAVNMAALWMDRIAGEPITAEERDRITATLEGEGV